MSESVQTTLAGGILRICINRPARLNAIDLATMSELADVIAGAAADSTIRVIVLTGEGRAFCTGADLAAAAASGGNEASPETVMAEAARMIRAVVQAPIPVIAQINGPAAGVGASLALAADLHYAAESTYLLLPFTAIGLLPDGGATALVPAGMGRARAMEMALLSNRLPAPEAAAAGLITAAVPDAELTEHVYAIATRLAAGPRRALELTKAAVNAATLSGLEPAFDREATAQIELLVSPDFYEGTMAMLGKRAPRFTDAPQGNE